MGFTEELVPYTESDGLILERVKTSDGAETGNGIFNLSLVEVIKLRIGESSVPSVVNFCNVIQKCEVEPGLFYRGPMKKQELEAFDDYVMLCGASYLLNVSFAKEVLSYAQKHTWSFNSLEPGKWTAQTCFGRYPFFIPYVKLSACQPDGLMGECILGTGLIMDSLSKDADTMLMGWMRVQVLKGRGVADYSVGIWERALLKKFPNGMQDVASQYYGPAHPITKYIPRV